MVPVPTIDGALRLVGLLLACSEARAGLRPEAAIGGQRRAGCIGVPSPLRRTGRLRGKPGGSARGGPVGRKYLPGKDFDWLLGAGVTRSELSCVVPIGTLVSYCVEKKGAFQPVDRAHGGLADLVSCEPGFPERWDRM